jgi:hypothetical protein
VPVWQASLRSYFTESQTTRSKQAVTASCVKAVLRLLKLYILSIIPPLMERPYKFNERMPVMEHVFMDPLHGTW